MIDCESMEENAVDEFFNELTGDDPDADVVEWQIQSDLTADKMLKTIKRRQGDRDRLIKLAEDEIAELQKKIEAINSRYESSVGWIKTKLFDYFNRVSHKETKTQETYKLLNGSLVLKKESQKMSPDKVKLLDYCKNNNMSEFIKVKEEVDWATYKKECQIVDGQVINNQTGEVIPADIIAVEDVPGEFGIKL